MNSQGFQRPDGPTAIPRGRRHPARVRGAALLLVLGLLAITLALCYGMLRSQMTTAQIQRNSEQRVQATFAAEAGLRAGLVAMSGPDWGGVGTTLRGTLGETDAYEVCFLPGDDSLQPTDPDYSMYAYRVTLLSTGTSRSSVVTNQRSVTTMRCVAQLIPRRLAESPAGWQEVKPHTLYQWSQSNIDYEMPVRVEGSAWLQGRLLLCYRYPSGELQSRFLADLEARRVTEGVDHRPFSGPIYLPFATNTDRSLLVDDLRLSVHDAPVTTDAPCAVPTDVRDYQLYPGGPTYEPQILPTDLGDQLIEPDPVENPLAVWKSLSTITLNDNANFTGTMLVCGSGQDLRFRGTNVRLQATELPQLHGDPHVYQLAVVSVPDDVYIYDKAEVKILGAAVAGDDFELVSNYTSVRFDLTGKLVCGELELQRNGDWMYQDWSALYSDFQAQQGEPYFPVWLEQTTNLSSDPQVTIRPAAAEVVHHWHDWTQPLFQPHPDDGGLRWEVVSWTEVER